MTMNRITMHHAASGYKPSVEAKRAYHRMIDGDGEVHHGDHAIEDNLPQHSFSPGSYAAHTLNLNSGNIGVAILAMSGASWADPFGITKFPVKPIQVDSFCKCVALLAIDYNILVDRRLCLSHAEVQTTLGIKQRNKWDFDYDPRNTHKSRDPIAIGDELRQEIAEIRRNSSALPDSIYKLPFLDYPTIRQGSVGEFVTKLQSRLGVVNDGRFGPVTRDTVIDYQRRHQLLPDGIVGPLTWLSLFSKG